LAEVQQAKQSGASAKKIGARANVKRGAEMGSIVLGMLLVAGIIA
jgi:hypothetical protein